MNGTGTTRSTFVGGAIAAVLLLAAVTVAALRLTTSTVASPPTRVALPLRQVASLELPGDGSRFDYASLDAQSGLLFVAHLGASQVIEVDVRANKVVRVIDNVSDVHGVLVVPARRRVYATATGSNTLVILDEGTGAVLARSPTGNYPDGISYDPARGAIWTTNETGGTETVVDAETGAARGSVDLGGEAEIGRAHV